MTTCYEEIERMPDSMIEKASSFYVSPQGVLCEDAIEYPLITDY